MSIQSELANDVAEFIKLFGIPVKIDQQSRTFTAGDYDVATFAVSGTQIAGSALFFPVSALDNEDVKFIEQGKISVKDKKIYIYSGINFTQDADVVIDSGSYNPIQIINYALQGDSVYSKVFLRTKI